MPDLLTGALEFAALSRRLKDAGEGGLLRELSAGISAAARPALGDVRAGLPDHMPNRYAGVLAGSLELRTLKEDVPGRAGVRVLASARGSRGHPRKLPRLEGGVLGHPLFGLKAPRSRRWLAWYEQTSHVRAGFFSGPLTASAPMVRDAVLQAMHDTAEKIAKG